MTTSAFPPTIDELLETFEDLQDWDDRYDYLIELGRELPPLPAELQTEAHKVEGCMSSVWMVARPRGGAPRRVEILADSDSLIVKGLIALLLSLYSGKTAGEILSSHPEQLFAKLGLNQHLSATRRNGLYAMLQRIRQLAAQLEADAGAGSMGSPHVPLDKAPAVAADNDSKVQRKLDLRK